MDWEAEFFYQQIAYLFNKKMAHICIFKHTSWDLNEASSSALLTSPYNFNDRENVCREALGKFGCLVPFKTCASF